MLFDPKNKPNQTKNSHKTMKSVLLRKAHKDLKGESQIKRFKKLNWSSDRNVSKQQNFGFALQSTSTRQDSKSKQMKFLQKLRFTTTTVQKVQKTHKFRNFEQRDFRKIQKRNKEQNFNTCYVRIIDSSTGSRTHNLHTLVQDLNYHVIKFGEFVNYLKRGSTAIVGYQTVPQNLVIDYMLSKPEIDGSFMNGSEITLKPIYKQNQPIITLQSFQLIKCIGTGGFSKVFLCRFLQDGKFYAMKIIEKQQIAKRNKEHILTNQLQILKKLSGCPFIIDLKFAFETRNYIIFVLEYCPGSEFFNMIKKFKRMEESVARFYLVEILLGLQSIHSNHILYRDFKPENIIIDIDGHIRIADFGLSKPMDGETKEKAYSFCGSPEYMPPEIIAKAGHSYTADFYSLGALLYEMLTGLPPFYSQNIEEIYEGTLFEQIKFPKNLQLSVEVQNLVTGLLNKNEKQRYGCLFGVKEILAHPWFGKIDKKAYKNKEIEPPANFISPRTLDFDFSQFEKKNDFIQQIRKEKKKKRKQLFDHEFYYDSRTWQTSQASNYDTERLLSELVMNQVPAKTLKKYAFHKRQSKIAEIKAVPRKSCKQKSNIGFFRDSSLTKQQTVRN